MFEILEKYSKKMTYNDYAAINDGKRYELLNGELIMVPAPSFNHQRSNRNFFRIFDSYINDNSFGEVVFAPTDVILDDNNTVQPDILFISKKHRYKIDEDGGVHGAPDLVVEVISPSSKKMDRQIKKGLYEKYGVLEYWIIDLKEKSAEVYENIEGKFNLFSYAVEQGKLTSKLLLGFEVNLEDILPDL